MYCDAAVKNFEEAQNYSMKKDAQKLKEIASKKEVKKPPTREKNENKYDSNH